MSGNDASTTPADDGVGVGSTGEDPAAAVRPDGELRDQIERAVSAHRLPDELARFADRYERVSELRDRFVWKWFHLVSPSFRLSSVDERHRRRVRRDKTLLTFYVTLVDDLLEARGDRETFRQAAGLPFERRVDLDAAGVDDEYLALTRDVWRTVERAVDEAPYGDRWDELFRYDLRQVLNSIRYSSIVTRHEHVANMTEAYAHGSHNMVVFPYAAIDLMHSSRFDPGELAELRRLLWQAQQMARIGNWVSTWERELSENDYSSGVLVRALERDVVTTEDLLAAREDPVRRRTVRDAIDDAGVETELLQQWLERYHRLADAVDLETVDVDAFLDGMKTVLRFHLGSKGLK